MCEKLASNVRWTETEKVLTLEELPVIEYNISRPTFVGLSQGGKRMERYYNRLADRLVRRWSGEGYFLACLDYAKCNERAQYFKAWQCSLCPSGAEVLEGDILTLSLTYREERGGHEGVIQLVDRWKLPWGCPLLTRELDEIRRI